MRGCFHGGKVSEWGLAMAYTGISDLETSMATFYSHTLPKVVTVHICIQSMLLTQFPTLDAGSSDQSHYNAQSPL